MNRAQLDTAAKSVEAMATVAILMQPYPLEVNALDALQSVMGRTYTPAVNEYQEVANRFNARFPAFSTSHIGPNFVISQR